MSPNPRTQRGVLPLRARLLAGQRPRRRVVSLHQSVFSPCRTLDCKIAISESPLLSSNLCPWCYLPALPPHPCLQDRSGFANVASSECLLAVSLFLLPQPLLLPSEPGAQAALLRSRLTRIRISLLEPLHISLDRTTCWADFLASSAPPWLSCSAQLGSSTAARKATRKF